MKPRYGTRKEWAAVGAMIDLAGNAVSDAEFDHTENKKTKRRNGGYSADLRIAEKYMSKWWKHIQKEENEA